MAQPEPRPSPRPIQWESFYRDYRKPGYIPGFEIQVQLGSGAFGIVFKATKESIGKPYAIKFLKVDTEEIRDAVMRELDAVRYFAQIDHPNLVSIEDMGDVDGIPYIVMAFAGDDTLRRRIDAGELDREQALALFQQIARGVQALHEHSLVHFDIKPANVYLKGDVARIGDYGLSKLVTDSRNTLSMGRGTPFYMAPELLKRKGDARSDIYALGVMLYE
ncbi:MAG: serine/threonine protein kinase, partial [Planctomycetes bacterium]|nr:serine/threonine protein kinase [Planctomycetota bacterium]